MLQTYKYINEAASEYLQNMLIPYKPSLNLQSINKLQLKQPEICKKTLGDRAFQTSVHTLWNKLPIEIKTAKTVTNLKVMLKTHLFSE